MVDKERIETLINAIRLGNPLKTACNFAGLSDETVRVWRRKGEAALELPQGRRNPTQRKYADFVGRLDKSLAEANFRAQATIHALMTQDVRSVTPEQQRIALQAAQFFLTHRDNANYTTRTKTEVSGVDGAAIEVDLSAERAWERMVELLGVGGGDVADVG